MYTNPTSSYVRNDPDLHRARRCQKLRLLHFVWVHRGQPNRPNCATFRDAAGRSRPLRRRRPKGRHSQRATFTSPQVRCLSEGRRPSKVAPLREGTPIVAPLRSRRALRAGCGTWRGVSGALAVPEGTLRSSGAGRTSGMPCDPGSRRPIRTFGPAPSHPRKVQKSQETP